MTRIALRTLLGQRSRSASDGRSNVNTIASESLKGFEPELTEVLATVGITNSLGFQGHRFKGQGHRKHFPKVDFHNIINCERSSS